MDRRKFIYLSSLTTGSLILTAMTNPKNTLLGLNKTEKMPVLFMGHGSPMNGLEDNKYTKSWSEITKDIRTPQAILVISAHWETQGTQIFAGERPQMIYDMYGFPKALYDVKYSVSGDPALANQIANQVHYAPITPTLDWGLDHGAWSVLKKMYPKANIPCFQLSLNRTRDLKWHYELAQELRYLRDRGVLILGSGNIVHNLRYMAQINAQATDWALDFDQFVAKKIIEQDHQALIAYEKFGQAGLISVNSAEHYIPLLYVLAQQDKNEPIQFFNHNLGYSLMDVFMRCLKIG